MTRNPFGTALRMTGRTLLLIPVGIAVVVALLAWRIWEAARQDWPAQTGDDSEAW